MKAAKFSFLAYRIGVAAGGAEKQMRLLMNSLIQNGYEVKCITSDYSGFSEHDFSFEIDVFSSRKRLFKYVQIFLYLFKFKPDFIVLRGPSNLFFSMGLYAWLFRKKVVFFGAHDLNFTKKIVLEGLQVNAFLVRWLMKKSFKVIVQNNTQMNGLRDIYQRDGELFYNAIDIKPRVDSSEQREYLFWVGRFLPEKQPEKLFSLARQLPDQQFVVVAPFDDNNAYHRQLLTSIKEISNIQYIPDLSGQDINQLYRRSKCLLITSSIEGFPNTFLEAWNNSTPVFSFGLDVDNIIAKSNGKLGTVFNGEEDLLSRWEQQLVLFDSDYCYNYLKKNHCYDTYFSKFERALGLV